MRSVRFPSRDKSRYPIKSSTTFLSSTASFLKTADVRKSSHDSTKLERKKQEEEKRKRKELERRVRDDDSLDPSDPMDPLNPLSPINPFFSNYPNPSGRCNHSIDNTDSKKSKNHDDHNDSDNNLSSGGDHSSNIGDAINDSSDSHDDFTVLPVSQMALSFFRNTLAKARVALKEKSLTMKFGT